MMHGQNHIKKNSSLTSNLSASIK